MTDRVRAFIFNDKREFLVLTRDFGPTKVLLLPGGGVEPKENLQFALSREMHEEIGIGIGSLLPLPIKTFSGIAPGYGLLKFKFFTIKPHAIDLIENKEPTKHVAIEWLSIHEWRKKINRGYEPGVLIEDAYRHAQKIKIAIGRVI